MTVLTKLAVNKNMKAKKNLHTTTCIIFWDYAMFYEIFLSPKVKRCEIITYKHGIYKMPHEFPNDLRLRILGS